MGQIFCALVLLFVILSVDARSMQKKSEDEDTLCSQDHPLYPFFKLFNVIPEEWKSENDNSQNKKPVCFARTVTTETDEDGNELNKFSSYEITFGLPKKYEGLLGVQEHLDDGQEFVNYPPFEETIKQDDNTTKNVVYIRCSKNNEGSNTTPESLIVETRKLETTFPPDITTVNHDLDFLNDLDEICDEHLDVDILNSLPDDDATPEPDFGNTRRNGADFLNYTVDKENASTTEATEYTTTEYITIQPEVELGTTTEYVTIRPEVELDTTTEYITIRPEVELDTTTKYITIQPETELDTTTEYITIQPEIEINEPSILSRMHGASFTEITTELSNLITQILAEMNNSTETTLPTTAQQDYTISISTLKDDDSNSEQTVSPKITTQQPVIEEVRKSIELLTKELKKSEEHNEFIVQMKNIISPNYHAECYLVNSRIKYGKCVDPIVPVRILTESKLPKNVKLELVDDLENNRDFDEIIVSGKKHCYLLKNLSNTECPANHDDIATILEIDSLPDNPSDDPFFTIEFEKKCTTVSKHIDVIECPIYQDTLPHLKTEHLPDHVRLKHSPGVIDVHVDDMIVHSYSHCLLLKTIKDIECREKPNIVLKEDEFPEYYRDDILTTDFISDEDSLPTYRLGDYSLEKASDLFEKSFEITKESVEYEDPLTTPCNSEEDNTINSDSFSRTTRTLSYPTTEVTTLDNKLKNQCADDDIKCLIDKIQLQATKLKSRETLSPHLDTTKSTEFPTPTPTTITSTTEVTEITIPHSKKLSKLLKTIIDESKNEPMPRSSDTFKPDFIVKVACAQQIFKTSCFYVSKYIMQPTFDDPHDYNMIIDKDLLPTDVKIVQAPNLNIFEANETIFAMSDKEKFVLIKKNHVDCPADPKESFFVLDTGSCSAERRDESFEPSIVKYQKGSKVYCFDFDDDMRLYQVKCPEDLTIIPVLSRPQDLKTLCRSQLKNKGHNEQMKLLRRMNIVTDYN